MVQALCQAAAFVRVREHICKLHEQEHYQQLERGPETEGCGQREAEAVQTKESVAAAVADETLGAPVVKGGTRSEAENEEEMEERLRPISLQDFEFALTRCRPSTWY